MSSLFTRAVQTYRSEGLRSVLWRGLRFISSRFIEYRTYYLTEHTPGADDEAGEDDVVPRVEGVTFTMVTSSEEAQRLEATGYGFRFHPHGFDDRKALERGAVASCVFVGPELAAVGWCALTQRAMDTLDEPPMKVDFSGGDAFIGTVWTKPRYRRMGLRTYRVTMLRRFLLERGVKKTRGCVARGNSPALSSGASVGDSVYAEGRYLRVLWWKWWQERPLTSGEPSQ